MSSWGHTDDLSSAPKWLTRKENFDGTDSSIVVIASDHLAIIGHGFATGDPLVYRTSGTIGGLKNGRTYFAIRVTGDALALATTLENAELGTKIILTSVGLGEDSLQRYPANLHYIDVPAAYDPETRAKGIQSPGWWTYDTHTDVDGDTRHRSDHLINLQRPIVDPLDIYTFNGFVPDLVFVPENDDYYVSSSNTNFDEITGGEFARASDATFVDYVGEIDTKGVNIPRLAHYLSDGSGGFSLAGMLQEGDGVTNLLPYSEDLTHYSQGQVSVSGQVVTEDTATSIHRILTAVVSQQVTAHTVWVDIDKTSDRRLYLNAETILGAKALFDLSSGSGSVVDTAGMGFVDAGIVDKGDYYRAWLVGDTGVGDNNLFISMAEVSHTTANDDTYTGDGTSSITVRRVQYEAGNIPGGSSYIHTTGSTVDRADEELSISIPVMAQAMADKAGSAELVDINSPTTINSGWTDNLNGTYTYDGSGSNNQLRWDNIGVGTSGEHYLLAYAVTDGFVGLKLNGGVPENVSETGPSLVFSDAVSNGSQFVGQAGQPVTVSAFSVREVVMPDAITIVGETLETYADEDDATQSLLWRWRLDGGNYIDGGLQTHTGTGRAHFASAVALEWSVNSDGDTYIPGSNRLMRWGATYKADGVFANQDGNQLAPNLNPTSLADLVNSAFTMGTAGNRIWKKLMIYFDDIGDLGRHFSTGGTLDVELVDDSDFNTILGVNWTDESAGSGTTTIGGGKCTIDGVGNGGADRGRVNQVINTPDDTVFFTINCESVSGTVVAEITNDPLDVGGPDLDMILVAGDNDIAVNKTSSQVHLSIWTGSGGGNAVINSASVKKLLPAPLNLGPNLLSSGTWIHGPAWSGDEILMTHTATSTDNVRQDGIIKGANRYLIKYDITESDEGGFVAFRLGDLGNNYPSTTPNTVGSYEFVVIANSVDNTFALRAGSALNATFENISVQEVS